MSEELGSSSHHKGGRRARRHVAMVTPANAKASTDLKKLRHANAKNESNDLFDQIDADRSKSIGINELIQLIKGGDWPKVHEMFQRLNKKLHQEEDKTAYIMAKVALELATGKKGQEALDAEITKQEFHQFRKKYILDEFGAEELHQIAIFENFDPDGNGELDKEELERFLGVLYHTESGRLHRSRHHSMTVPQMRDLIMENCDVDGDETISFNELRSIISGGVTALEALHAMKLEKEKEKAEKKGSGSDEDEEDDDDDEEESEEEEEEDIEAATRKRAMRLLSMLETPEEKQQNKLLRSQYLSTSMSGFSMDGSASDALELLEESDEEDEEDEKDETLTEILEVSDEEEAAEEKIKEDEEVKDATEDNAADAGMHQTSDNSVRNQEETEVAAKPTEVVSDESEKVKATASGDVEEEIVMNAGTQQTKEASIESHQEETTVAKATEPASKDEQESGAIGRSAAPSSGSENAQAEGAVVEEEEAAQETHPISEARAATTDALESESGQGPENTPETTPESTPETEQPSLSTLREPETETPAEITVEENSRPVEPNTAAAAAAAALPPPAVTDGVDNLNIGTPNITAGTPSTGTARPTARPTGGIVSDSLDESHKDFDFCLWLDKLFFPNKKEEERDSLCMRLSRHGSKRRIGN